jgi:hypothetical protein
LGKTKQQQQQQEQQQQEQQQQQRQKCRLKVQGWALQKKQLDCRAANRTASAVQAALW